MNSWWREDLVARTYRMADLNRANWKSGCMDGLMDWWLFSEQNQTVTIIVSVNECHSGVNCCHLWRIVVCLPAHLPWDNSGWIAGWMDKWMDGMDVVIMQVIYCSRVIPNYVEQAHLGIPVWSLTHAPINKPLNNQMNGWMDFAFIHMLYTYELLRVCVIILESNRNALTDWAYCVTA